jgi:diguanylate cyclase (GGDEF)-like protein
MIPGAGYILLNLSPQHGHLSEYLADAGHDVIQGQWGLPPQLPLVIVTDHLPFLGDRTEYLEAATQGLLGIVAIESREAPESAGSRSAAFASHVDCRLPAGVTGRELATVVRLVARIAMLRRQQAARTDECQKWIELAMHDPLTGLPNRRNWEMGLQQALADPAPLGVAMIDVDFFKQINDADGHSMGDQVLREVALALRSQLRRNDFVARLGGDEFGVLIPDATALESAAILDRLREQVSAHLASLRLPSPTLSAGLVHLDRGDEREVAQVMAAASRSLRHAKQRNRNCTVAHPTRRSHS